MEKLKTIADLQQSIVDYFNAESEMYHVVKNNLDKWAEMAKAVNIGLDQFEYKCKFSTFTPLELHKILSTLK